MINIGYRVVPWHIHGWHFNIRGQGDVKAHSKETARSREFDAIAVFEDTVILSEIKSTLRLDYVKDFSQVIHEFFDYLPEFAGKRLIPIFASLSIEDPTR